MCMVFLTINFEVASKKVIGRLGRFLSFERKVTVQKREFKISGNWIICLTALKVEESSFEPISVCI